MNIFLGGFAVLCVICALLFLYTRSKLPPVQDASFHEFQRTYLVVYLLAMAGDWLQGPHVYALYESYGMTTHQIEILFVAGFGSSMIFGTVVGSFADKYGRRNNCILYGILYGGACITKLVVMVTEANFLHWIHYSRMPSGKNPKHFNNFWVLMLGRLLGGIATSILYSAFESWLVNEHNKRGFEGELLGNIFSHAILGNSIVAITAGIVAQYFADMFGFVAPFDVSLTVLMLMSLIVICTWPENYGNKSSDIKDSMLKAAQSIKSDPKILYLGLIQSLFEGSMYVFVLEWTPALTPADPSHSTLRKLLGADDNEGHRGTIPHGHIFAAFMVSIMIGSSLFKLLSNYTSIESFMRPVLFVAAISLSVPVMFAGNQLLIFIAFLVFETCVGIFWPSIGTMRGKYVPEETRATVMNFFRIPLNMIVVVILLQNLSMAVIFECCVLFLIISTACQHWLFSITKSDTADSKPSLVEKEQVV